MNSSILPFELSEQEILTVVTLALAWSALLSAETGPPGTTCIPRPK